MPNSKVLLAGAIYSYRYKGATIETGIMIEAGTENTIRDKNFICFLHRENMDEEERHDLF